MSVSRSSTRTILGPSSSIRPIRPKRLAVLLSAQDEGMHAWSSTEAICGSQPHPIGSLRTRTRLIFEAARPRRRRRDELAARACHRSARASRSTTDERNALSRTCSS